MLPFLNKGADGVKELMQQSDKLGNTLSGKDLQAVKDNTKAKREWHATIQGLQIQLGRYLFPALTSIGEIMVKVSGFVEKNGAVMKPVILVVAALVAGFKAWSIGLAVFNAVMAANPIALVVIGVAALAAGLIYAYKHSETFRKIVDGAFKAVGSAFSAAWGLIKAGFGWLKSNWPYVLGILVGPFGLAAAYIYKHWDAVVGFVKGIPGKLAAGAKGMWNFLKDGLRSTLNWIVDQLNQLHFTIGGGSFMGVGIPSVTIGISGLHHFATGTQSASAGFALVGEQGPEIVRFGGGEQVSTAGDTARMLRGGRSGGGDTYNVYASSTAQGSDIVTALRRFKQESGGGELGIA
jgi:phage-related tail protein